jgi:hypothetical protein
MEGKDTEQAGNAYPREDDRNELVEGDPAPDPTDKDAGTEDDPQAD